MESKLLKAVGYSIWLMFVAYTFGKGLFTVAGEALSPRLPLHDLQPHAENGDGLL